MSYRYRKTKLRDCEAACSTQHPRSCSETKTSINIPKREVLWHSRQVAQSRHYWGCRRRNRQIAFLVFGFKRDGDGKSIRASLYMTLTSISREQGAPYIHPRPTGTGDKAEWSKLLFPPGFEKVLHAVRVSARENSWPHSTHIMDLRVSRGCTLEWTVKRKFSARLSA